MKLATRIRWHDDGERHGSSWLAVDYFDDDHVVDVVPVWGPTTRSASPPSYYAVLLPSGREIGRARNKAEAKRLARTIIATQVSPDSTTLETHTLETQIDQVVRQATPAAAPVASTASPPRIASQQEILNLQHDARVLLDLASDAQRNGHRTESRRQAAATIAKLLKTMPRGRVLPEGKLPKP